MMKSITKFGALMMVLCMILAGGLAGAHGEAVVLEEYVDTYGQGSNAQPAMQSDPVRVSTDEYTDTAGSVVGSEPIQESAPAQTTYYRVNFYDMYGWEYAWAEVPAGSTAEAPREDPYVEGFVFHYWFDEQELSHTPFDFSTGITRNVNLLPRFTALNTIVDGVVGNTPQIVDSVVMSVDQMNNLINEVLTVTANETGSNVTMTNEQMEGLISDVLGSNVMAEPETVVMPSTQVGEFVDQILAVSTAEPEASSVMTQDKVDALIADVLTTQGAEPEALIQQEVLVPEDTQVPVAPEQPVGLMDDAALIDEILADDLKTTPPATQEEVAPMPTEPPFVPVETAPPVPEEDYSNILDQLLGEKKAQDELLEAMVMPEDSSKDLVREIIEEMILVNAPETTPEPVAEEQVLAPEPEAVAEPGEQEPAPEAVTEPETEALPEDVTLPEEEMLPEEETQPEDEALPEGEQTQPEDVTPEEEVLDELTVSEDEGEEAPVADEEVIETLDGDGNPADAPLEDETVLEAAQAEGPSVLVKTSYNTETMQEGTWVMLEAELIGVPEGKTAVYQWQNNAGGEFCDVPGATGSTYTFVADETTTGCHWQVNVSFID